MNTKISQNIKSIILAVIVVVGVSYASAAGTWTPPSSNPPGGNVEAPINVGGSDQKKTGGLEILGALKSYNFFLNGTFTFNDGTANPTNKVLTALDSTGKVGWVTPNINNAVTKIVAGSNIQISPTTGIGDVTINANSVFPTYVGAIPKGGTKDFGTDWKVIMLNGQYDPGSGGDSGSAGGYIIKNSAGEIYWVAFLGQNVYTPNAFTGNNGTNGTTIGTSAGIITVIVNNGNVTVKTGGAPTTGGVQLTYTVLN